MQPTTTPIVFNPCCCMQIDPVYNHFNPCLCLPQPTTIPIFYNLYFSIPFYPYSDASNSFLSVLKSTFVPIFFYSCISIHVYPFSNLLDPLLLSCNLLAHLFFLISILYPSRSLLNNSTLSYLFCNKSIFCYYHISIHIYPSNIFDPYLSFF